MTLLFTPALVSASVLGFLSSSDTFVILFVFAIIGYVIYRVINAVSSSVRNNNQAEDYINGRNQQTQLLTEILAELKKLNQKG